MFGEGFYPSRRICWVRATEQVATRAFDAQHKNAKPDGAGYLPTDGVVIRALLENDEAEDFLATPDDPLSAVLAQAKTDLHESHDD